MTKLPVKIGRYCVYLDDGDLLRVGPAGAPQYVLPFVLAFPKPVRRKIRKALHDLNRIDLCQESVPLKMQSLRDYHKNSDLYLDREYDYREAAM